MDGELPWEELMDDLFASILSQLDSPHVAWVSSVCSKWKTKAQKLLHCIQYRLSDDFPFQDLVDKYAALKEVTLTFHGQQNQLQDLGRLGDLQKLHSLQLSNTKQVLEFPHLDLSQLENCQNLRHLRLDGCSFSAASGIQNLVNLESLAITSCAVDVREPTLAQILHGLSKLKVLRIEQLSGGSSLNLRGISNLSNLEELILRVGSVVHPELAREVNRMHKLRVLDLNVINSFVLHTWNDESLSALAFLDSLQELNLGGHCQLTDNGIEQLARLSGLTSLDISVPSSLHLLAGHNHGGLTDLGLRNILSLTKLRSLSLSFSKMSNGLMISALQRFKYLRHLCISNCNHINDTALFNLDLCPHLTSLDVSCCRHISDLGLFGLGKVARQLRILDISGCHQRVSDLGVRQLAQLKMLSCLSMAYCEQVTDYGIQGLISGTPYLSSLSLRGCQLISNSGIEVISAGLSYLKELDLGHCYALSNESVRPLSSMKCLARVALNDTGISRDSCARLREKGIAVHRETRWWMA